MTFAAILILVVTALQAYVFWRAASVPGVRRHLAGKRLAVAGIALWGLFLAGLLAGAEAGTGMAGALLEGYAMNWLGILFLMAVAMLAVDLATGFGLLLGRFLPALRGAALALGALLVAVALFQGLRAPVVQNYSVTVASLPAAADGTVIVALSDLHLGSLLGKAWLDARIDQVQAARPDLIVLLGDVFEGHGTPAPELFQAMRRLSAPLGVWGVLGNHEFHGADNHAPAWFAEGGVRLLRNTWGVLRPGLVLAGFENPAFGSRDKLPPALALAGHPPGATILLSHEPLAPDAAAASRADLVLSGHSHGGQIWPSGYLVARRYPLFAGRYEVAGTTVVVSRGTGTWGPRMRLWQPAEIVRITLAQGHGRRTAMTG